MKRLTIGCCLLLAACGQPAPEAIDGDTFRIGHERYRLFGVDSPELHQTCLGEGLVRYKCGVRAREALSLFLSYKNSKLDCITHYTDTYGRKVVQCHVGGHDLGGLMVRSGWAIDYVRYSKGYYAKDEQYARERKIGLHEGPFTTPEDYRRKNETPTGVR